MNYIFRGIIVISIVTITIMIIAICIYIYKEKYTFSSTDKYTKVIKDIKIRNIKTQKSDGVIILMYADDRFGAKNGKYKDTETFVEKALQYHPDVREVISLQEKDLFKTSLYKYFKKQYDNFPSLTTGGAGNGFKPYFMIELLLGVNTGDYILWHDVSPEIWNKETDYRKLRLTGLMDACRLNKGLLVGYYDALVPDHTHRKFTNPQCLDIMGLNYFKNNIQWCTSWVLVQKSDYTMKIIKEWLYFILTEECAAVFQKKKNREIIPDFYENRSDQSVLTLLMLREGLKPVHVPQNNIHAKNIFSIPNKIGIEVPKLEHPHYKGKLPKCFATEHVELGEREVADTFTKPDACVLEFGGGSGAVSTIVQKHLNNPKNHVVIQPREGNVMFGGLINLEKNKKACNLQYQIIDHILKKGEGQKLFNMVSKPFDTIVCDCEGCLYDEYKKNPNLFKFIKQIQVERDDFGGKYDPLFKILGLKLIHKGRGCGDGNPCETHVFEK